MRVGSFYQGLKTRCSFLKTDPGGDCVVGGYRKVTAQFIGKVRSLVVQLEAAIVSGGDDMVLNIDLINS
jgi:hypothetical protein